MSDHSSANPSTATGYEIVADLLVRQEQVLQELDQLNNRIEATIQSITETRQRQAVASELVARQCAPGPTASSTESKAA